MLAALLVVSATGCGDGATGAANRQPTVKVTGSVVDKSGPVADAVVTFVPVSGGTGRGAFATTDAQGKFALRTWVPGDGAVRGQYKVTISKVSRSGELTAEEAQAYFEKNHKPPPDPVEKDLLPTKFKDINKTPLTADVNEAIDLPPFDLTK